jgi:hypothetical protein
MKIVRLAASLPLLAVVACGGGPVDKPPPMGLYQLAIHATSEACQPARTTGTFTDQPVWMGDGMAQFRVPFDPPNAGGSGFSTIEVLTAGDPAGSTINPCGTASYRWQAKVVSYDERSFDVTVMQSWIGVSSCDPSTKPLFPSVPDADCSSTRLFHFDLTTACQSPCRIVQMTPVDPVTCNCPN